MESKRKKGRGKRNRPEKKKSRRGRGQERKKGGKESKRKCADSNACQSLYTLKSERSKSS